MLQRIADFGRSISEFFYLESWAGEGHQLNRDTFKLNYINKSEIEHPKSILLQRLVL